MCCIHALTCHINIHAVVVVEFEQSVYTILEANCAVIVCLQTVIETKMDLEVTVTASEKSPVDAQGTSFTCSLCSVIFF